MSVLEQIKGGLIVSCQALPDEPLHSSFIMGRMALAAEQAGAIGIRANSVDDIKEIKEQVDLPIIGIIKKEYGDNPVFITPTLKEVREVAQAGAEIIAMDATIRERPEGENLADIVKAIRQEFPDVLLMADIATMEDLELAEALEFDFVGPTLYGYTEETKGSSIAYNDFEHLRSILETTNIPVIAEGNFDTPEKAKRAIELGVHSVVTGSAITRPQLITKKFVDAVNSVTNN